MYIETMKNTEADVDFSHKVSNSMNTPEFPSHRLQLKVGMAVLLLRNLDPPRLCNGTRLIVEELRPKVIRSKLYNYYLNLHPTSFH